MKHDLILSHGRRVDGGLRTTVTIDGATALDHFRAGKKPPDPVILWDVDVRCEGPRLPAEPAGALRWLSDQGEVIRGGLTRLAERLEAGVSPEEWPLLLDVPGAPRGVRMSVYCIAFHPMTLRSTAKVVRDLRDRWDSLLTPSRRVRPASA